MLQNEGRDNQNKIGHQEASITRGYFFYGAHGFNKHRKNQEGNHSTDITVRHKRFPFQVNIKQDWLQLFVSILTLLLLGATVFYTRQQWIAADASAQSAHKTLIEMQSQTALFRQQTEGTFGASITIESPRPISLPQALPDLKRQGFYIYLANVGKVDAVNLQASGTMTRAMLPSYRTIGKPQMQNIYGLRQRPFDISPPGIPGFNSDDISLRFETSDLSLPEVEAVNQMREAVTIEGSVTYLNGFGTTITRNFCFLYTRIPIHSTDPNFTQMADGTWGTCVDMKRYIANDYKEYPR